MFEAHAGHAVSFVWRACIIFSPGPQEALAQRVEELLTVGEDDVSITWLHDTNAFGRRFAMSQAQQHFEGLCQDGCIDLNSC